MGCHVMKEPEYESYYAAKRRYMRGGIGIPALAKETGLSRGTLSWWKRKHHWQKNDDAFSDGGDGADGLTPREEIAAKILPFVRSKTKAAELAGYGRGGRNEVTRAMQKPAFRASMEESRSELMDRLGITPERIVSSLMLIVDRCMEGYEAIDKKGNPITEVITVNDVEIETVANDQ